MNVSPIPTPGPAVTVRLARPAELDSAGDVVRRAYTAAGYSSGDYLDIVADARDRSRDADIAVAVEDRGRILGSVTFALPGSRWAELCGPGEAEFRMLGVDPSAQRRGVGRALAQWCVDRARIFGVRRLLLCSLPEMAVAHRLYQRLGFVRRPDLDLYPTPSLVLLSFSLDLQPAWGEAPAAVDGPGPAIC